MKLVLVGGAGEANGRLARVRAHDREKEHANEDRARHRAHTVLDGGGTAQRPFQPVFLSAAAIPAIERISGSRASSRDSNSRPPAGRRRFALDLT